jgi:putative PIN family toxin of toxin-antitoxin system
VVIGFHLGGRSSRSTNVSVVRRWLVSRDLQLIVSAEIMTEYFEVLERLGIEERRIENFRRQLNQRPTVTLVTPGPQPTESSDPDDNVILAAAVAGRAKFLITNDRHLLDIPDEQKRKFRFQILTPKQFLAQDDM